MASGLLAALCPWASRLQQVAGGLGCEQLHPSSPSLVPLRPCAASLPASRRAPPAVPSHTALWNRWEVPQRPGISYPAKE